MRVEKRGIFLVVLSVFLLVWSSLLVSAENGCYLFPGSSENFCEYLSAEEAEADCALYDSCTSAADYFVAGDDCTAREECQEEIQCNVDCNFRYLKQCQWLGEQESGTPGAAVENEAAECGPACCIIASKDRCQILNTKFECEQSALGYPGLTSADALFNTAISNRAACSAECGVELPPPDTGEETPGTSTITGQVLDNAHTPLTEVTIAYLGAKRGSVLTDTSGNYQIISLPDGNYTITASKIGYTSQIQAIAIVTSATADFTLSPAAFQWITGTTYVDENGDGIKDANENRYGVSLYINKTFKGLSSYPDGKFNLRLAPGTYKISAAYRDYEFQKLVTFTTTLTEDIFLTRFIGECSVNGATPNKNVETFTLNHLPGEKAVFLQWRKPCAEVSGYVIDKIDGEITINNWQTLSPADHTFTDKDVKWGQSYTYKIRAVYTDGAELRYSQQANVQAITLGNEECEGRYSQNTGWTNFCLTENPQLIYTCTDQNQVITTGVDCSVNGPTYYCAKISASEALCKDEGICSALGNPFGLFYAKALCYGAETPREDDSLNTANFCYFDTTATIVDECKSCLEVKNCFGYQSEDACLTNNCLGQACRWVPGASNLELIDYNLIFEGAALPLFITPETGSGYCTEVGYEKDDYCSLCSSDLPPSSLFENFFCTAEVCSNLGRCFSAEQLSKCESCGEKPSSQKNCYSYNTGLECTNSQPIVKDEYLRFTLSEDRCGWGRCVWQGSPAASQSCIKDGDADGLDDCQSFSTGEQDTCRRDNDVPSTKLVPEGLQVISQPHPDLIFFAADPSSPLGTLAYCLTRTGPTDQDSCFGENSFTSASYPGRSTQEQAKVNFLNSTLPPVDGETWKLKFYSKDKYHNQEDLKETFVFIDNVPPQFTVKYVNLTAGDRTTLKIYLEELNEAMACQFIVTPILPQDRPQIRTVERKYANISAEFADLNGVRFNINVTCTDDRGNVNSNVEVRTFNLDQDLKIIYPAEAQFISAINVPFQVSTTVGSLCSLYKNNEYVTDFATTEEAKQHLTETIPVWAGSTADLYQQILDYTVVCRELLTNQEHYGYFDFYLDFTAPETTVALEEGSRETITAENNWEEYFINYALITLSCETAGLPCTTKYCLKPENGICSFQTYSQPFNTNRSAELCYQSASQNGNTEIPKCGKIIIDGYGITLQKPELYYYDHEMWGVSLNQTFDWQFFTRVLTQECRFDFDPGFDYNDTLPYQRKLPESVSSPKTYLFAGFPESVFSSYSSPGTKSTYIICQSVDGQIGPEQKMNLEYDPTPPEIERAYASPSQIVEESYTTITIETDDKTICRYSDNSSGSGSSEYATMSRFQEKENTLYTTHRYNFSVTNYDDSGKAEYALNLQCQNGAGQFSEVETIAFSVDYSSVGYILPSSLQPSGFIRDPNVTLSLQTSKNANCFYAINGTDYSFSGRGTRFHDAPLRGLTEKLYTFPVKCVMGDHLTYGTITFVVDRTSPIITLVDDGNYSCGSDIKVMVYTNEWNISAYYYEVYSYPASFATASASTARTTSITSTARTTSSSSVSNLSNRSSTVSASTDILGNTSSSASSTSSTSSITSYGALGTLILNNTVGPGLPIIIPAAGMNESKKYTVKVRAGDAAGNWGGFAESDGVIITARNYSVCAADHDAPTVEVLVNDSSCTENKVQLVCQDALGCSQFLYGKDASSSACNSTLNYNGQPLSFTSTSWLCYYTKDNMNNNQSGKRLITFSDADGDKVRDNCDQCSNTPAGALADESGCADGQTSTSEQDQDTDQDGLPDYWEKLYSAAGCQLDYTVLDTDGNGVKDADEDYDQDGYTNFEEYTNRFNPCLANARPGAEPEEEEEKEETLTLPVKPAFDWLALLFLILGLLMFLGGISYLIYYYFYSPAASQQAAQVRTRPAVTIAKPASVTKPGVLLSLKDKLQQLRKTRAEAVKSRKREQLFSEFGKESTEIPHVEEMLSKKAPHLSKLQELSQHYAENKDLIKPGLRPEEKSIFSRLDQIAKETKDKQIHQVVSKDEAKDIFSQLREISKKRKEKEK